MSLCGTNDDEQLKIELLSQWKLEAEFRNKWFNTHLNLKHWGRHKLCEKTSCTPFCLHCDPPCSIHRKGVKGAKSIWFQQKVFMLVCSLCPLYTKAWTAVNCRNFSDGFVPRSNEAKNWARGGSAKRACLYSHITVVLKLGVSQIWP